MPVRERECAGTVSRNTAAGSVRQFYGKREERLAGRRCGKQNCKPTSALLPDERGCSPQRCNVPTGNNSAAIVPGIQEHENRAQLVPE